MKLSQVRNLALRLTIPQNAPVGRKHADRLVFSSALLLASLGVAVSSFSVKQLLSQRR